MLRRAYPVPSTYWMATIAALTARPEITREQRWGRCILIPPCAGDSREEPRLKETTGCAFPQLTPGVVGLAGRAPAPSSQAEMDGRALCYPAFPQLALIREWHKDGVG